MQTVDVVPPPDMSWLQPGVMVMLDQTSNGFTIRPATLDDVDPYLFVSQFYPNSAVYIALVGNEDNPMAAIKFTPEVQKLIDDCPFTVRRVVYMQNHTLL